MDSLDSYEFIYRVERELCVSIPDEKANSFESPEDCVKYLLNENNLKTY
jgi:acyl carrier protein